MRYLLACLLLTIATTGHAQYSRVQRTQLISTTTAQRFGLDRMWNSQLRVGPGSEMAGGQLHISAINGTTLFEIVEGKADATADSPAKPGAVLETITNRQLDPFGEVLGKEGAEKKAVLRVAELKQAGRDVSLNSVDVPDMLYVASTTRGIVQAIDAETGRTRWTTMVGRTTQITTAPAVSNRYVAVISGLHLYLLERDTGNLLFSRETDGPSVAAPVVNDKFVFVLSAGGMMQTYPVDDPKGQPVRYQSYGRAMVRPIITPNTVVWPTDKGHFYVAPSQRGGISFRIESDRTAVAPAGYLAPNLLYVVATDGYVYCVHERSGNILWSYPLAEEVTKQPIAVGDSLYVATDEGHLYCLDPNYGTMKWWQDGISMFVSRSDPYLYCLDRVGRLVTLDAKSGGRIQTMPDFGFTMAESNGATDRIFLATKSGRIQCLRTIGKRHPQIHVGGAETTPTKPAGPAAPPAAGGAPAVNPFAPGAGGGAAPAVDPFAPGAGGAAPAADPFAPGAGGAPAADPFAPAAGGGGATPDPFAPAAGGGAAMPDPFAP